MSFPRYPAYKESGVEWLGEVPAHWEVEPLKRVIARVEAGTSVNAIDVPAGEDELGVLKTSCVYRGEFDPKENKAVLTEEYGRVSCPVRPGTLIVSRMNTPELVGAAGLVRDPIDGLFLPDRLWQIHFSGANPAFVHKFAQSSLYRAQVQMACSGTSASMQNLGQDQFAGFILPLPPLAQQTEIVAFLDRETAKINALVAEQKKLIELLKEKRQAVISHAVTKGLDPNVPTQDSGVEWLGEVPAHWEVEPLKRVIARVEAGTSVNAIDVPAGEDELGVLKTSCVYRGQFDPKENKAVLTEEYGRVSCPVRPGTLIVSRMNTPELVGAAGLVRDPIDGLFLPDRLWQIHFSGANPAFVHKFAQSSLYRAQVQMACSGTSASMQNLGQDQFAGFILPLPPLAQQTEIVAFLDRETAKIDTLVVEAEGAIDLLKERRAALISAAVTGQIDVRGLSAEQATAAA